ncbi:hypothetical protein, partial [Escherichia coli]|uniref:hypothetical protein n=1 Tax=Escherichia coli TaxID=562 RepID=UPI001A7E1AA3
NLKIEVSVQFLIPTGFVTQKITDLWIRGCTPEPPKFPTQRISRFLKHVCRVLTCTFMVP